MTPDMYEATIGTPGHLQHTYVYDTRIRPRVLSLHELTISSVAHPGVSLAYAAVRGEGKGKSEGEADCTY